MSKIRVNSNIAGLQNVSVNGIDIDYQYYELRNKSTLHVMKYLWQNRTCDYLLFNGSGRDLFIMGLFKHMFPRERIKIISLDLLLPQPQTVADNIKCMIRRMLLKKVHMFILYYKNTKGIEKYYKIPSYKFRYIPFKINQYTKVLNAEINDGGYVFCGGKTRRDFNTLIEAVRGLNIPVRIVTMENADIAEHGSHLDDSNLPHNVQVIRLDGSFDPFLKQMAESRLVVVPLKPHICGTGIGVYIMAMALKKCVVISADVSVDGVLNNELAIIVTPCDPIALKSAIEKAYQDDFYRKEYEKRGYDYAISLGGEEKLYESIMKTIIDDYRVDKENADIAHLEGL